MTKSRESRAAALERWADTIQPADLREIDSEALRVISDLARRREAVDDDLEGAVDAALEAGHSWALIGTMLGMPEPAARQRYG